ncbi:hypothetical protein ACFV9C_19160 [Kribbella sp. NPDC059898]|uniref:hypothetical protein n=1 Tax=Kribbella sp. NPDC059898 TaxID=3346995 RepID=UPI00365C7858
MSLKRRTVLLGAVAASTMTSMSLPAHAAGLPPLAPLPAGAPGRRLFAPGSSGSRRTW